MLLDRGQPGSRRQRARRSRRRARDGRIAPDRATDSFRTAYARWIAPLLIDARPELTRFRSAEHDDLIARFRKLDAEIAETTAGYIRARLSRQVAGRDDPERGARLRRPRPPAAAAAGAHAGAPARRRDGRRADRVSRRA